MTIRRLVVHIDATQCPWVPDDSFDSVESLAAIWLIVSSIKTLLLSLLSSICITFQCTIEYTPFTPDIALWGRPAILWHTHKLLAGLDDLAIHPDSEEADILFDCEASMQTETDRFNVLRGLPDGHPYLIHWRESLDMKRHVHEILRLLRSGDDIDVVPNRIRIGEADTGQKVSQICAYPTRVLVRGNANLQYLDALNNFFDPVHQHETYAILLPILRPTTS